MPYYIMDLRRLVGHRPLLMPAASVILEDGEGRVLLQLLQYRKAHLLHPHSRHVLLYLQLYLQL